MPVNNHVSVVGCTTRIQKRNTWVAEIAVIVFVEIFFRLIRRMHNGIIYACVRDSHPTDTVAVQLIKRVKIVAIYHFVAILSRVVIGGCSCDLRKTLSVITFRRDTCRLCFCDSGFRLIMSWCEQRRLIELIKRIVLVCSLRVIWSHHIRAYAKNSKHDDGVDRTPMPEVFIIQTRVVQCVTYFYQFPYRIVLID